MIQEILKEYDEELPKAFHRGKETMPEFYRAFLEKSLKRVEEETLKGIPCQITSWCDQGYEHDGNCKGHATYTLKV